MAKSRINDYSATPVDNTDIGGIPILGTSPVRNFDDAFREIMSQLADMAAGTSPVDDTMTWNDPADDTKGWRIDAEGVPTATIRALNAEVLYRQGAYIETIYTASGTHTFATSSKYFQIEAVGGGGGGGAVDGQSANTRGAASGGGSGFFGRTTVLTKGAILTGAVVVGTGGAGGTGAGNDGTDGVATTWVDSSNSFTWGRGRGGIGQIGRPGVSPVASSPAPAQFSGALIGSANFNTNGFINFESAGPTPSAVGGIGASSAYGIGGTPGVTSAVGGAATGYGSGGGGAATSEVATNFNGGAGAPGLLIVREW